MFKKIVVPVDGSESAWRALEQAAALACKFEGELLVMTVIQPYNNAALLAIQILAVSDEELAAKLLEARRKASEKVLAKNAEIEARYNNL